MRSIYLQVPDHTACGYYRAVLPGKFCTKPLEAEGIRLVTSEELNADEPFDAYLFHRFLAPGMEGLIEELKGRGSKIVWELDDNLFDLPAWNPFRQQITAEDLARLNWCLDLADKVVVSTEPLRRALGRTGKTVVCPNLPDADAYPVDRPGRGQRLRILWTGSECHKADLELLVKPLWEVARVHDVEVVCFGSRLDLPFVKFISPVPFENYFKTLAFLAPDIALCPLVDLPFNDCKSGIKYYECAGVGAAVIASKSKAFSMVKDGRDGLLVGPDGWLAAIKRVLEDRLYRDVLSYAGFSRVRWKHSWQAGQGQEWMTLFRSLC